MEKENEKQTLKAEEKQKEPAETMEEQELEEEAEEEAEEAPEEEVQPVPPEEAGAEAKEEEVPAPVEEEEAKPPAEKEKPEEEIVEERIYTVPLGKARIVPANKRSSRAVRMLRSFIIKHMKLEARKEGEAEEEEPKRLIISNEVNEKMWKRGIEKPPRKIRVRAAKDKEGNVTVYLAEGD
ncbi:MAG: 50S ribosomal protein L31e [Candidatus Bathyarchaeia archaeon]